MATLLVVQDSLAASDLGIATASHQFSRTLGGTIGVGISGSFVTATLLKMMSSNLNSLPSPISAQFQHNIENLFRPEVQALLSPDVQKVMQDAVAQAVSMVFWITLFASLLCLFFSAILPAQSDPQSKTC